MIFRRRGDCMNIENQLSEYISEIDAIINILEDVLEYVPRYANGINVSKMQKQINDVIKDFQKAKSKLNSD